MDEKSSEEGPASLLLRQGWGQWRCRQMGSPCSVETWRRNPAEASRGGEVPGSGSLLVWQRPSGDLPKFTPSRAQVRSDRGVSQLKKDCVVLFGSLYAN